MNKIVRLLSLLPLLVACESKTIQGHIVDPFGQPIEGVTVSIDNTMFATTTNSHGAYQLDYAPGASLKVTWSMARQGDDVVFEPIVEELSITEKCAYPMPEKTMWCFPANFSKEERLGRLFVYTQGAVKALEVMPWNDDQIAKFPFIKVPRAAKFVIPHRVRRSGALGPQTISALLNREVARFNGKKKFPKELPLKELHRNDGLLVVEMDTDDRIVLGDTVVFIVNKPHRVYATPDLFGVVLSD